MVYCGVWAVCGNDTPGIVDLETQIANVGNRARPTCIIMKILGLEENAKTALLSTYALE